MDAVTDRQREITRQHLEWASGVMARIVAAANPIPEGAMRVAPGSDAVVWRVNSDKCGEL
jgi:hypothetical protein